MVRSKRNTDPNPLPPSLNQTHIAFFNAHVDRSLGQGPNGDCWQWTGRTTEGYGMMSVDGREVLTHRLAYFIATGEWPTQCVLHRCDNPPCCNPAHHWQGTRGENCGDTAAKGRTRRGARHPFRVDPSLTRHGDTHPHSKMNEVLVLELRALNATRKFSASDLERIAVQRCGQTIRRSTVMKAVKGETWKHIKTKESNVVKS